ncbi:MAG: DUF4091 domain-containing protein [Armatimonadetes bacterium]|nr:DUF4091 domain-containing protein [Armatimonadota bacterium]
MRRFQLLSIAFCLLVATFALSQSAHSADPPSPLVMPVERIVTERWQDDSIAAVTPERLELACHSSASSEWDFSFAGFETRWRGPIRLEVRGSGGYQVQDIFSIAAISLDYGVRGRWPERSFFGMGLIQGSRNPHPPSWGAESNGKFIMRGNLLEASQKPQRLTIDPQKYAPKGWDGRLWIGLVLHNTGRNRWLRARIVNTNIGSKTQSAELDIRGLRQRMQENQTQFLGNWLQELSERPQARLAIPVELAAYFSGTEDASPRVTRKVIQAALEDSRKEALGAKRFLSLTGAYFGQPQEREAAKSAAQAANDLVKAWRRGGGVGKNLGCIVRVASNMEKVGLKDLAAGRVLGNDRRPVQISAARNEHEAFQIILTSLDGAQGRVKVRVQDLRGASGRIPASSFTTNAVGYVRIFRGEAHEALWPDPLLIGDIPDLKPGENQPVWVSLHVPAETPPGVYRGKVAVRADNGGEVSVPLEVTVRNFCIPKKISLRSSFWLFRDQLNRFYHKDEIDLDDYLKWVDFALDHRLCPVDVYEGQCAQLVDIVTKDAAGQYALPNPNPDWSKWDRYMQRMVDGGASTVHLGVSHHHGAFFADKENPVSSAGQVARVIQSLKTMEEHYREKGWFDLHYVQLRDETSAPDSLNVYKAVREQMPELNLLLTAPSTGARPYLRIPCPLTPSFDAGWRDEMHKEKDQYWWYVCVVPKDPYANLFIFQSVSQHRALFWQTWKYGVDGLLYWGLNFWAGYEYKWPQGSTGPRRRVAESGDPNFCPLPDAPGDGFSMYPGPQPGTPMSSMRLEAMRDGEEDYEYLVLLDRLIGENRQNKAASPALKEAITAREAAERLTRSVTDHERNPVAYQSVREQLARGIEGLSRIAGQR